MSSSDHRVSGRPALQDDLIETIAKLVVMGADPKAASATLGVTGDVYEEWMADGKENRRGKYRQRRFVLTMERSVAQFEVQGISKIRRSAEESWQAAAWLLERRLPEKYVRKSVSDQEQPTRGPGAMVAQYDPFRDLDNVTPMRRPKR
jgi:hypothetical protein